MSASYTAGVRVASVPRVRGVARERGAFTGRDEGAPLSGASGAGDLGGVGDSGLDGSTTALDVLT